MAMVKQQAAYCDGIKTFTTWCKDYDEDSNFIKQGEGGDPKVFLNICFFGKQVGRQTTPCMEIDLVNYENLLQCVRKLLLSMDFLQAKTFAHLVTEITNDMFELGKHVLASIQNCYSKAERIDFNVKVRVLEHNVC
ncbi:hypothetical protein FRX31_027496 [Thalictrum thalictroides]|uniref:Uncharacterized protein n=1 Tax=Thalictrum thalictroides TaxID=46969 RepID=A0A7J6VE67_THATH|nr:hypothetical protein FRX31_027496 [Thalictrum thalictroides]